MKNELILDPDLSKKSATQILKEIGLANPDKHFPKYDDSDDVKKYIEAVENYASRKSDFVFSNSSDIHAAIVMTTMLSHSKKDFILYDEDLSNDVAGKYYNFYPALINFIQKNSSPSLHVVIDKNGHHDTPIYKLLKILNSEYPEKVNIYLASDDFKDTIVKRFKSRVSFAVGDSSSFRLEQIKDEKVGRKAICSFKDHTVASLLAAVFNLKLNTCKKLF